MALQAAHTSGSQSGITPGKAVASDLADFNLSWSEHQEPSLLEWKKWLEIFTVAMMAKQSISFSRLTRVEMGRRFLNLMGGPSQEAAKEKMIRFLFLSICQDSRKTLLDKFPAIQIAMINLHVLLDQCRQTLVVKRSKTLARVVFFP